MKAAQISKAGGDFELVERDLPEPGPGQVRIKVEACGVCHSDELLKRALARVAISASTPAVILLM
jgi:D-arabinose 1-dehydrogenase-like Zn-dependent alcohol dehydrogenase